MARSRKDAPIRGRAGSKAATSASMEHVRAVVEGVDSGGRIEWVPAELIDPNPFQPRKHFDPVGLEELAETIRTELYYPPIVRVRGGRKQIVVGERRFRAMRDILGWTKIPVEIRDYTDREMLTHACVENDAREDLSPWEWALATVSARALLLDEGQPATHPEVAATLGFPATESGRVRASKLQTIANAITDEVLEKIAEERLAQGGIERPATIHDLTEHRLYEIAKDVPAFVAGRLGKAIRPRSGRPSKADVEAKRTDQRRKIADKAVRDLERLSGGRAFVAERLAGGRVLLAFTIFPEQVAIEDATAALAELSDLQRSLKKVVKRAAKAGASATAQVELDQLIA